MRQYDSLNDDGWRPDEVFARIPSSPGRIWLDSGADGWTVITGAPAQVIDAADGWPTAGRSLQRPCAAPDGAPPDLPFCGGVIGYVGYGAGHAVETVPPEAESEEPAVWLARYDQAIVHHPRHGWAVVGTEEGVQRALSWLRAPAAPIQRAPQCAAPARLTPRAQYETGVRQALAWITAGDIYQLNLTHTVRAGCARDPDATWAALRARSRPWHGARLDLPHGVTVLSNSPETLLTVHDRTLCTRPIKGTRPRDADPERDAALATALLHDPKEIAELTMIVDLARNDLGRVAVPGTVLAAERRLHSLTNVHHAEQPVSATLRPGLDAWDALAAVFPPASVTGCPKVRAAQRIAELEDVPRGLYCGSIGIQSDHGRGAWSVAIRTAILTPTDARFGVGAGIVADSDPGREWQETLDKASVLAGALDLRLPA